MKIKRTIKLVIKPSEKEKQILFKTLEEYKFAYINPKYTSQRCSKCGYVSKSNRKDQSHFKCSSCGYTVNADLNASRNIAINYLVSQKERLGHRVASLPVWVVVNQPNVRGLAVFSHC